MADIANQCVQPAYWNANLDRLVDMIVAEAQPTDHILVMSNGSLVAFIKKFLISLNRNNKSAVNLEPVFKLTALFYF